jgi:hypothetical protein
MTPDEIKKWHNAREATFAVSLPPRTVAEITVALEPLELKRALAALETYRHEKPYRGFYWLRFMVHYNKQRTAETDTPSLRLRGAALPEPNDGPDIDYAGDQRREIEMFEALGAEFVALCETLFGDWGIRDTDARAWRILCIDHHAGRDVTPYRRHLRPNHAEDMRVARIHFIHQQRDIVIAQENEQLRMELKDVYAALEACKKGVEIDVFA